MGDLEQATRAWCRWCGACPTEHAEAELALHKVEGELAKWRHAANEWERRYNAKITEAEGLRAEVERLRKAIGRAERLATHGADPLLTLRLALSPTQEDRNDG